MRHFFTLSALLALTLATLVGLGACGEKAEVAQAPPAGVRWPDGWPSVEERTVEPGFQPTPYTWQQLRQSSPTGMRVFYRVDAPGADGHMVVFAFDDCDEKGLTLTTGELDLEENVTRPPHGRQMSWFDLQAHHSAKAEDTVLTSETITVPAGTFECVLYTTTREIKGGGGEGAPGAPPGSPGGEEEAPGGGATVEQFWFRLDKPGPFVRRLITANDEVIREMTLVRVDGGAGDK